MNMYFLVVGFFILFFLVYFEYVFLRDVVFHILTKL